jgi:glutamine synthetase
MLPAQLQQARRSRNVRNTLWPAASQGIRGLEESLRALEEDQGFLRKGDVFTSDVIDTWIDYKREHEIDPVRLRPHPWEFHLYFDV